MEGDVDSVQTEVDADADPDTGNRADVDTDVETEAGIVAGHTADTEDEHEEGQHDADDVDLVVFGGLVA